MPPLRTKVADEYFSVRWLLSSTTLTFTPRRWASTSALARGADAKYARTSKVDLAFPSATTTASVQPSWGDK
jgi:hypothetical protein